VGAALGAVEGCCDGLKLDCSVSEMFGFPDGSALRLNEGIVLGLEDGAADGKLILLKQRMKVVN
jgi:hypothetical protein